jgi:hypothetical protein
MRFRVTNLAPDGQASVFDIFSADAPITMVQLQYRQRVCHQNRLIRVVFAFDEGLDTLRNFGIFLDDQNEKEEF